MLSPRARNRDRQEAEYLGWVLAVRSGLAAIDDEREALAATAAGLDNRPDRLWRFLADTAVAAQLLYGAPSAGRAARRGVDFYPEGILIWLEVDVTIRSKTQGKKSLDDFCVAFHGGKSGPPSVRPYDLDEVVKTLDTIAPNDWKGFFHARVDEATPHAPLGGITEGGWKLAFDAEPNEMVSLWERVDKFRDVSHTLGLVLDDGATVIDVIPGTPAAKAGLAPAMKLIAIDGRKFSSDALKEGLVRAKGSAAAIELLVESGDFIRAMKVEWHGGCGIRIW